MSIWREDVCTRDNALHIVQMGVVIASVGVLAHVNIWLGALLAGILAQWWYEIGQFMGKRSVGFLQAMGLGGERHKILEVVPVAMLWTVPVLIYTIGVGP